MFDVGAIVGSMVLDTKQWDNAVASITAQTKELSKKARDLGQEFVTTGKHLDKLGNKLALIGGLGIAPFALAVKNVAKENGDLQMRLDQIGNSFKEVQRDLATAMIPTLDMINNSLRAMGRALDQINPSLKNLALGFVINSSVALIFIGGIVKMIGLLRILWGEILIASGALTAFATANPLTAIIVGISLATVAIVKFRAQIFEIGKDIGIILVEGIREFGLQMMMVMNDIGIAILNVVAQIPFLPKAMKEAINEIIAGWDAGNKELLAQSQKSMQGISTAIEGIKKALSNKGNNDKGGFFEGFHQGLVDINTQLHNFYQMGVEAAGRTAQAMETAFSDFFFNVITGQFKSLGDVVKNFGLSILRMITDLIAKMIVMYIIMTMLGIPTGTASVFSAATGGGIKVPGHQDGTEAVPYTGLFRLHEGEKVTPKYDAANSGKTQPIEIYNFVTEEAIARAMSGRQGKNVVVNIINEDSLRNGSVRRNVSRR